MKFNNLSIGDIINFSCFAISIIIVVVGFILPPTGVIDSSVLIAVGELGFFSTVSKIPDFVKALKGGAEIEIKKGENTIHLTGAEAGEKAAENTDENTNN